MPISFRCSQCNQLLRVPDTAAGKSARCPKCQALMTVPFASEQESSSAQPTQPASSSGYPSAEAAAGGWGGPAAGSATPPGPPQPPKPDAGGNPFSDAGGSPFGGGAATGSLNPYASPAGAAYGYAPIKEAVGPRPGLPWEKEASLATWWETSKLCITQSTYAFAIMRQYGGMGQPMMFALLGMVIGLLAQMVWQLPMQALPIVVAQGRGDVVQEVLKQIASNAMATVVFATVGLLIVAAVQHVVLLLFGGANQGYETTYRVTAFVNGSIAWLNIIPCFGPLIGLVLYFVCMINGLAQAHECTTGKAAAAVILPFLLGIGLCVGLIAAFIFAVTA